MSYLSRARLLAVVLSIGLGAGLGLVGSTASAAAPKDSGLLAFVRANQIYTSTTTGASVKKITTSGKNYRPHWSPDGKRIAYVHETAGNVRNIWVMNANGAHKQQVTHQQFTSEPAWSPDGKWIAFGGDDPSNSLDGGRLQKIKSTAPFGSPVVVPSAADSDTEPFVNGTLDWSRDGKNIVFASENFPSSPDNYLLDYTFATARTTLIAAVGGSCCGEGYLKDPTWTPDSKSVALSYLIYGEEDPVPPTGYINILHVSGSSTPTYPAVTGDADPDYSPTGHKLVFSHYSRIFTSDTTGAHRKNITSGYYPDWQPVFG